MRKEPDAAKPAGAGTGAGDGAGTRATDRAGTRAADRTSQGQSAGAGQAQSAGAGQQGQTPPGFPPISEELINLLLGACGQEEREKPSNPFLAAGQGAVCPESQAQMSAAQLAELAGVYPQLRRRILSHPNCSERVRQWIQREDPVAYQTWVKETLAEQAREQAEQARQFQRDRENQAATAAKRAALLAQKKRDITRARVRKRVLKPVAIALGVLAALALAVYVTYLVALEKSAPQPVLDAAPAVSAQPTASPTPTPSRDEDDWARPVDFNASQQGLVSSPDGKVICHLQDLQAGCSMAERSFAAAGLQDCAQSVFSLAVDPAGANLACGQDFRPAEGTYVYVLQPGEQVYWGEFACTYLDESVSCWNQRTGVGFELSEQKYSLGEGR